MRSGGGGLFIRKNGDFALPDPQFCLQVSGLDCPSLP